MSASTKLIYSKTRDCTQFSFADFSFNKTQTLFYKIQVILREQHYLQHSNKEYFSLFHSIIKGAYMTQYQFPFCLYYKLSLTYRIAAIWSAEKSAIYAVFYSWSPYCTLYQKATFDFCGVENRNQLIKTISIINY